jgi:uncharacterized protein YlbG (UPF0298 family)
LQNTAQKGEPIMSFPFSDRLGLAVWVKDLKAARSLRRLGNIHFVSKRLKYVYLYIDGRKSDQTIRKIERLPYVTRVERSPRREWTTTLEKSKDGSSVGTKTEK